MNRFFLALSLCLCGSLFFSAPATAQNMQVVQLINGSGTSYTSALTSVNSTFTTNFKGTNDLTMTLLQTPVTTPYIDNFPASPGNNPAYLSNFVGATANGTGNGTAGSLNILQTSGTTSLRINFAQPLTVNDRMIVADVDEGEQYSIQAFTYSGGNYTAVSLAGWNHQQFTGQTGVLPNSQWAAWNPTGGGTTIGTLTSSVSTGTNLNEPLDVFTPDQSISQIIFTQTVAGQGTAGLQFMSAVPEPSLMILAGAAMIASVRFRRWI